MLFDDAPKKYPRFGTRMVLVAIVLVVPVVILFIFDAGFLQNGSFPNELLWVFWIQIIGMTLVLRGEKPRADAELIKIAAATSVVTTVAVFLIAAFVF